MILNRTDNRRVSDTRPGSGTGSSSKPSGFHPSRLPNVLRENIRGFTGHYSRMAKANAKIPLGKLPDELILYISRFLTDSKDIKNFHLALPLKKYLPCNTAAHLAFAPDIQSMADFIKNNKDLSET